MSKALQPDWQPAHSRDGGYLELVERRRALRIAGYRSLADVGFDGPWVTPYQISSRSVDGPALVAYNWLDAPSATVHRDVLARLGFLPGITFNKVLDRALALAGLARSDIYMTQAFHLLPEARSSTISSRDIDISFEAVTRHELVGRQVIALGRAAAVACFDHGVRAQEVLHPSARGFSIEAKAALIASALFSARH